ncbi:MAG: carbon-nitrogen family hydrolase [Negativicutes bacterium]|nr:carbon-nitrogen family hydrolase [Negativicutes bacterium]
MKVALVQMQVVAGDVDGNRRRGVELTAEAAANADIVVLPEIWTTGYSLKNLAEWAEDTSGPTITALADIARRTKTTVIAGSIPYKQGGRTYNSVFVLDESGKVISDYQKLHMCSIFGEERFFAPGERRSVFTVGGVKAGVAICYDLRFPELFRALASDGAEVIFVPAEWPAARLNHWRVLNQARAIENQVFICAVNCVGRHRDTAFNGHSMVVAPNGDILVEGDEEEGINYCTIDLAMVGAVRSMLNAWDDRRPDLFG